ncbi:MAG: SDR family NAD(P)-dependent oxidoreductase [Rhodospirillales bacterium]|nr:SDR family NAD(P)-dependent oxidoreductase [Rhodospirillales bacterium]
MAIVTGGTSGIGQAIAERLVREGATVVVGSDGVVDGQHPAGILRGRVTFVRMDVSREEEVEALVTGTVRSHGQLDIMVNNAGISGVSGGISSISAEGFDRTIAVLLRGVFLGIKHASVPMVRQGAGSIISMASITGLATYISAAHVYSAAKAAVIHLTRTVALELGAKGVRVNCICPGYIATPIFGKALGVPAERLDESVRIVKDMLKDLQPIARSGVPEDIANAALWLASDESSFVTGHALVVDGGAACGTGWDPGASRIGRLAAAMAQPPKGASEAG